MDTKQHHPMQHLFDLSDDELRARARLAHFRFQWHGYSEGQREHLRELARKQPDAARDMGFVIAEVEIEPTDEDIDAMLVDHFRPKAPMTIKHHGNFILTSVPRDIVEILRLGKAQEICIGYCCPNARARPTSHARRLDFARSDRAAAVAFDVGARDAGLCRGDGSGGAGDRSGAGWDLLAGESVFAGRGA
jgi:hypothetical protein